MEDIQTIQEELDAVFPNCKIQYVPLWGYWVVTDYLVAPDGSPATAVWYPTPWNLLQVEEGDMTNRKIVFVLSHPETGEPLVPSADNILNTMYAAYTGGTSKGFDKFIERIEAAEDAEEKENEENLKAAGRQAASIAFNRHKGKLMSTSAGITNMKNTDKFMASQMAAQTMADQAASEQFESMSQLTR